MNCHLLTALMMSVQEVEGIHGITHGQLSTLANTLASPSETSADLNTSQGQKSFCEPLLVLFLFQEQFLGVAVWHLAYSS